MGNPSQTSKQRGPLDSRDLNGRFVVSGNPHLWLRSMDDGTRRNDLWVGDCELSRHPGVTPTGRDNRRMEEFWNQSESMDELIRSSDDALLRDLVDAVVAICDRVPSTIHPDPWIFQTTLPASSPRQKRSR